MTEATASFELPSIPFLSQVFGKRRGRNTQSATFPAIPLMPQPKIQCNIPGLQATSFVNVVFENEDSRGGDQAHFRVSDENNEEICRVVECTRNVNMTNYIGVKYLECRDNYGNCLLLVGYPIGLGEVALLSPKQELVGECQSNVEFVCLSVKVKYNFYDANGKRLMKIIAIMSDDDESRRKFTLLVKRSKAEKLALIKMGSLQTCCHIKFRQSDSARTTAAERLQIIALWIGFMHNEMKDTDTPLLIERHAAVQQSRKESLKTLSEQQSQIVSSQVQQPYHGHSSQVDSDNSRTSDSFKKIKAWKNLVASHLVQRQQGRYNDNNNEDDKYNPCDKHIRLQAAKIPENGRQHCKPGIQVDG